MVLLTDTHKAKILIIDDQRLHSVLLQKTLNKEGYEEIECVNDPRKAISIFHDYQPDIVVLDLSMPQMDGFQVMEMLRKEKEDDYLPILTLSEEKSPDIRLRALHAGATDFLLKPFETFEILVRIRNMIQTKILHLQVQNQNKVLETKVRERTKELHYTRLEVIRRLAQAAECRDKETGQHIIRMSQYCACLGKALDLGEEKCDLILNASPLHDIGKIGIPDSILLKPGKLTPEEFEVMKTHTTLGANLLAGSNTELMKMAQTIALTHHEKWDGTGYPKGLKKDKIPLVGQVCSVCDVYDALTSKRPYKKAWSFQETWTEIVNQKGKQFNPDLVDAFESVLPDIHKIQKEYSD